MARRGYARAMDALYLACIAVSAASLVVITLIIPYGVFMRYALDAAASWPEPLAILLMIVFSFLGGAAVYRANVHMAVRAVLDVVSPATREVMLWLVDGAMAATCVFMIVWGFRLVHATWYQGIAEFPALSVGLTYAPVPVAGVLTLLFIVERRWVGAPPPSSVMYRDEPVGAE